MRTSQSQRKNICCWIGFIPGGLIVGIISSIAVTIILGGSSWLSGMKWDAPINLFLAAGISGYASTMAAIYIAPEKNKEISIIISATFFVLIGIGDIVLRFHRSEWVRIIEAVCFMIGVIISVVQVKNKLLTTQLPKSM